MPIYINIDIQNCVCVCVCGPSEFFTAKDTSETFQWNRTFLCLWVDNSVEIYFPMLFILIQSEKQLKMCDFLLGNCCVSDIIFSHITRCFLEFVSHFLDTVFKISHWQCYIVELSFSWYLLTWRILSQLLFNPISISHEYDVSKVTETSLFESLIMIWTKECVIAYV